MFINIVRERINEYPQHVVIFRGHQAFGAIDENANVLRHALYCNLTNRNGLFTASHSDLKQIEDALNRKKVSYILLDDGGGVYKKTSFKDNQYWKLSNKYSSKRLMTGLPAI